MNVSDWESRLILQRRTEEESQLWQMLAIRHLKLPKEDDISSLVTGRPKISRGYAVSRRLLNLQCRVIFVLVMLLAR